MYGCYPNVAIALQSLAIVITMSSVVCLSVTRVYETTEETIDHAVFTKE